MQKAAFSRSVAEFTLDSGRCPQWLFQRMVKLAKLMIIYILEEFSAEELVFRLSDSVWFQSFGSVLAFDWNASGLTTTTLGAIKVALKEIGEEKAGIFVCGGKGKTARKTPQEIIFWADRLGMTQKQYDFYVRTSKLTAKVDSSLIQDGFNIYHHNFIFTKKGEWAVIQQGMNNQIRRARRYHWYSKFVRDFTQMPHSSISKEVFLPRVFNLVLKESKDNKKAVFELVEQEKNIFVEIKRIRDLQKGIQLSFLSLSSEDFISHPAADETRFSQNLINLFSDKRLTKTVNNIIQRPRKSFDDILLVEGVGPKTIRALSLLAEIIYGAKPSFSDPVRYTYAFGGKDGIPYPVDKDNYDKIIEIMQKAVRKSAFSYWKKTELLKKIDKNFSYAKTNFRERHN